jgi:hypothetical protein
MVPMHVYTVHMPAGFPIVCWLLKFLGLVLLHGQMPGLLWFMCPVPYGSYAWSLGVSVPGSLWFLCLIPWGSCAEFPVSMTSFPKVLMPISLWSCAWFLLVPLPSSLWVGCLFLMAQCLFILVPVPGSPRFLSLFFCGS